MADKTSDSRDTSEQAKLVQKVDAELKPDPKPAGPKLKPKSDKPPIDIFEGKKAPVEQVEVKVNRPADVTPETEPTPEAQDHLDNQAINQAVDEIAEKESDTVLAVEDAASAVIMPPPSRRGFRTRLKAVAKNKKTWLVVAGLIIVLLAIPFTRYKVLGLAWKKSVTVTVLDSKTDRPVSNAVVELDGRLVKTDSNGKGQVKSSVGNRDLIITKKYYKSYQGKAFIGLFSTKNPSVELDATGRQVPVTVLNSITGEPLSGAELKILDTTAKTDKEGKAIIVLPTKTPKAKGSVSLNGYNTADNTFQITSNVVEANTVRLTPAGQVYLLSNRSGTLDVVKTNLDGSGRKTILKGTGREDANTTSLLASRDWRYLVLKARRDTANPSLYLIDTSNDKITEFDSGAADFRLVGWYSHNFVYEITRKNLQDWQAGRQALKSYNAERSELNLLDQTRAEGNATKHAFQQFENYYIVDNAVAYTTSWLTYSVDDEPYNLSGKSSTIRAVNPDGQNKKDYKSFAASAVDYIQAMLYKPQEIYYSVYNNGSNKYSYYEFQNQSVKPASGVDEDDFNKDYPTFLLSPSGNATFWSELRDGKNSLFTGNENVDDKKQIAELSEYAPYGWFSDDYVLVSRNSSELYVLSAKGLAKDQKPLKVSDYYKPSRTYSGYGYGYGGL